METRKKCAVIEFGTTDPGHFNQVKDSFDETSPAGWTIDLITKPSFDPTIYYRLHDYIEEIKDTYSISLFTFGGMSIWYYPEIFAHAYYEGIVTITPHFGPGHILANDQDGWYTSSQGPVGSHKFQWMVGVGTGDTSNNTSYGGALEFYDVNAPFTPGDTSVSYTCGRVGGFFAQLFDEGFSIDEARQVLRENCSLYPHRTLKDGYGRLSSTLVKSYNDVPEPLVIHRGGPASQTLDTQNYIIKKESQQSVTLLLRKLSEFFEVKVNGQVEVSGRFDDFPYRGFRPEEEGFFNPKYYNLDGKTKQVSIPIRRDGKTVFEITNIDAGGKRSLPLIFTRDLSQSIFTPKRRYIGKTLTNKL